MKKKLLILIGLVLLVAVVLAVPKIKRLYHVLHLFDADRIVENFRTFNEVFPSSTLSASKMPLAYQETSPITLPNQFTYNGMEINTDDFLKDSKTTGLIVIQNDKIVHEAYYLGNTDTTRNISWSMAKSYISTLVGIAVDQGYIRSINEQITTYVPELLGSGYEGVTIKNVLQMATGVGFDEDYGSFTSDINKWGRGFALGNSQNRFAASLTREMEPGIQNHYVSINTHVLGMLINESTGMSITDFMQKNLWEPLGTEHDAYWIVDDKGMEVALGGLNVTLRDFAKIGSLFLHDGYWNGKQIVSKDWVAASIQADAPYLEAGPNVFGYGYQWWIPYGNEGEFLARGVYNQNIYINPSTNTVIVKLSANDKFNDRNYLASSTNVAMELFRSIAHLNQPIDSVHFIIEKPNLVN